MIEGTGEATTITSPSTSFENDDCQNPLIPATGACWRTQSLPGIRSVVPPPLPPSTSQKTVAVSGTCRVRGRGEIPKGTLTLPPVWNRHVPPLPPNRGRTRCPRNSLRAVPCTRGLFWRIESTYLDFALLPALVGDVAVTCYHLWLSKKCHRVIISFSGCRCPESSHPQIQPLRRIHRE